MGNSKWVSLVVVFGIAVMAIGCSSDETEIGNSGVTEEDIAEAVQQSEQNNPLEDRPSDTTDDVSIRANLCEITDPDVLDDGLRRRVWISVENEQPEIVSVVADIEFTDGSVLRSEPHDVGAMFEGDPGSNSFGTPDVADIDPSREGEDCFEEIASIKIAEIGEPVWMTPEDDASIRSQTS